MPKPIDLDEVEKRLQKEGIKMASKLKIPSGKGREIWTGAVIWHKSGGYAHTSKLKVETALKANGFTLTTSGGSNSPDGNVVSGENQWTLVKGDTMYIFAMSSSYGVTKSDNYYRMRLSWQPALVTKTPEYKVPASWVAPAKRSPK